jgi:hypothetical protein
MQIINRIELKLENFDKCAIQCDHDCPLGILYDYSCALQSFIFEKMKAAKDAQNPVEEKQTDIQPE